MAGSEYDPMGGQRLPPRPGTPGSRPIPVGDGANRPKELSYKNRPVALPARGKKDLSDLTDDRDTAHDEKDELQAILQHAPAWLFSTVFHMVMLLTLGLLAVAANTQLSPEPEVGINAVDPIDAIGSQLEDPSILEGDSPILENAHDEMVITPKDLPQVNDPLASPLEIGDLKLGAGPSLTGPEVIEGAPIGLALKGRQAGSKTVLLGRYGGTAGTEKAVELGLQWLAKQQRKDGSWSLRGPYSQGGIGETVVAATAMALLAFQGHGDTHRSGTYSANVTKGWTALLKMQRKDGLFTGEMTEATHMLYAHAQATIALCELVGMTNDSVYKPYAQRAVTFCLESQDKEHGGWRYYAPRNESDTSVTGWFVMALQSARMAKLEVPEETWKLISTYLDSAAIDDGRRYGYMQTSQPSLAVSAEGLLCRQYMGWPQDDVRLVEGVSALNNSPINYNNGARNVYYWYYATQATHHMEGKIWQDWNRVLSKEVPAHQVKSGPEAGSWDSQGDIWGPFGGRLYSTCLSIYMLEVYYRHLPIYSGYRALAAMPPVSTPPPTAEPASDSPAAAESDADAEMEMADEPSTEKP